MAPRKPAEGMKIIKVTVNTGYVNCGRTETFEIEQGATDDEINEVALEIMLGNMIEWGWEVVTDDTEED